MSPTARSKLVASAIELVRRHGVAGTGIAQLLEHSGVARRTVYLNFPGGKSQLIAASTEAAGDGIASMMRQLLSDADAAGALTAFVQWWKGLLVASDFSAGCPIAAAALGRSEAAVAADVAGAVFTELETVVSAALEDRGVGGDIARSLAATVVAAIEGAVIVCLAKRDTTPLDHVGTHLAELIARHTDSTATLP